MHVAFVMGKSRVSSVRPISVPWLELTAAVACVKMSKLIQCKLGYKFDRIVYWTDSIMVLHYIQNESTRFKVFAANRVDVIHQFLEVSQWRHVDTKQNPADITSRGLMPNQISHVDLWINGPNFLLLPENYWPAQPECLTVLNNADAELKRSVSCVATRLIVDPVMKFIDHYSSLNRLQRIVACFLRVKASLMTKRCAKHLQHKPVFDVKM